MFIIFDQLASEPCLVSDTLTLRCQLSPARTSHARSFLHHPRRTPQNKSSRNRRIECTTTTCHCCWDGASTLNLNVPHCLLVINYWLFIIDHSLLATGNWSIYSLQIMGYHLLAIDFSWLQASAAEPAPGLPELCKVNKGVRVALMITKNKPINQRWTNH